MSKTDYDLCIIGGGINGAGIARDAAGRGLSVLLIEAEDLAQGTSSASTKLIHGGLRYLEYFEFSLVRKSLREREKLLLIAPHIMRPMEFVLPYDKHQRPYWMIRFGLFLYDHLAKRERLEASHGVNLQTSVFGAPLEGHYDKGFTYSDCWVDDSRLVALNAVDAAQKGAKILTRTLCTQIIPQADKWLINVQDKRSKKTASFSASMTVNATGPWVRKVLEETGLSGSLNSVPNVRLVKGSHIIIPKKYEGEQAYILQQSDGRIVFIIPYEGDYTLIGTTEEDYDGDLYHPNLSDGEMKYLCDAYNYHFQDKIKSEDVIHSYSGVRPLFDDGKAESGAVTRDFVLHEHKEFSVPMISVFGGKLTTYRMLAEQVLKCLRPEFNGDAKPWTCKEPLPGGDLPDGDFDAFLVDRSTAYPWLPANLLKRYARAYGTRMALILKGAKSLKDLGTHYGYDIYESELRYLIRCEWAEEVEDILWRRSKLGLHVDDTTVEALERALPELKKEVLA